MLNFATLSNFQFFLVIFFSAEKVFINGQEEMTLFDRNLDTCVKLPVSNGCGMDATKVTPNPVVLAGGCTICWYGVAGQLRGSRGS